MARDLIKRTIYRDINEFIQKKNLSNLVSLTLIEKWSRVLDIVGVFVAQKCRGN